MSVKVILPVLVPLQCWAVTLPRTPSIDLGELYPEFYLDNTTEKLYSLHAGKFFKFFLSSADFFLKKNKIFFNKLFQEIYQCQMVWIQVLSVLV